MQDFSQGNRNEFSEGDFILADKVKHMRYSVNTDGLTEFRMVPQLDDNGQEVPFIIGEGNTPDENRLSDAMIKVDLALYWGTKKQHYVCGPPAPGAKVGPIHLFWRFINDYVESHPRSCPPEWRRWLGMRDEGDRTDPKRIINAPSKHLLIQGYLLKHKGKPITDKEGKATIRYPVVLCIKTSGAKDMLEKLLKPMEDYAPWSAVNNQLGDICSLASGSTLQVIPYDTKNNGRDQVWYKAQIGQPYPLQLAHAQSVWVPWNKLLNFNMPIPQLMMNLADTFSTKAVVEAFDSAVEYRSLIPKALRELASEEAAPKVVVGEYQQEAPAREYSRPAPEFTPPLPAMGMPTRETHTGEPTIPAVPHTTVSEAIKNASISSPAQVEDTIPMTTLLPPLPTMVGDLQGTAIPSPDDLRKKIEAMKNKQQG